MAQGNTVKVKGRVGHETPKALQFFDEHDEGHWIPFSVVEEINRDDAYIVVQEWFAKKEGL